MCMYNQFTFVSRRLNVVFLRDQQELLSLEQCHHKSI